MSLVCLCISYSGGMVISQSHETMSCSIGGCGSFYAIKIKSEAFKGLPMVKQHRMVNDALKEEIQGIHGLQVRTDIQEMIESRC